MQGSASSQRLDSYAFKWRVNAQHDWLTAYMFNGIKISFRSIKHSCHSRSAGVVCGRSSALRTHF